MSESSRTHGSTRKKGSWGKRIGIGFGVLLLLLVVAYFVGTSGAFIKSVILPRVGSAMNAKVTVNDISVSPFSQVHIRGLRVETIGTEPLVTAEEVRLRYSLMDIIGGNINVQEVTMNSPIVTIVTEADGSSNLDPILKGDEKKEEEKPKSDEPTKLNVQNVALKNGTVRQIQKTKDGGVNRTELQNIYVTLDRLGNGQSGKLTVASAFNMAQQQGGTNSVLNGDVSGGYDIALTQDLMPSTVKGSTKLNVARGEGVFADMAGFNATLDADLTPTELKQVALRFGKGQQQLGQLLVSGPLDAQKKEGKLNVQLRGLDKNVLALATAGMGYDFRNSTINSTNDITISQNGSFIAAQGNLAGSRISLAKEQLVTPEMDLGVNYQVAVNTSDKSARIETLNVTAAAGGKEFLRTVLDQQMNLSWGEAVKGYKDAALRVIVTNFNLAEWRAVVGTNVQSGLVNSTVALVSQRDGRVLNADANASIANLSAEFGSNRIQNATVTFTSTSTVEDMKTVNVPKFTLALQQGNAAVLQASGAARYQMETKEATAQLTAEGALPRLMALATIPDANATAGQLKMSANYTDVGGKRKANGNFSIEDFTGKYGEYVFTNFLAAFDYNVEMEKDVLEIHRAGAKFGSGVNAGGNLELKGRYDLAKSSGQFSFQTTELNQHLFGPVLAPSMGENKLISISLNASGEAKLDPAAESAIKADVKVANWVVQDAAGKRREPLSADIKVDGGMQKEVLDLRQVLVQLTPTARAKNALQLQAKLDLAKTNPSPSTVSIRSESFDVTPYYDMFAGGTKTNEAAAAPAPAPGGATQTASSSGAETEPEPMTLPFQQLAAELNIGRLYLREIAISNWVGNVTIRSNVVQLNPFKLEMNGGAMNVTGNFDVGKPGYVYQLGFTAKDVPLAPLANSLELANSNQLQGTFVAAATLKGAGITGPSLKKNLGGEFDFRLTNINYTVGGPMIRRILVPISLAVNAPELAETPLNWVSAETMISNGVVRVESAAVESEAFYATLAGTVTLENVTSNSTIHLPMDFWLRRSLAERAKVIPANTPEDARFARLGNIYSVRGTVGAPEADPNKTVLAGLALRGVGGIIGDDKAGQVLGGLGNILTGNKSDDTNATGKATNNAASPVGGALDALGGLLNRGGKSDSKAPTNAPPKNEPAKNPIGDLLRGLGGSKNN
ncbi:MAG TPA: AsmA family protein [Verrucomicrobiae bacterium]